MLKKLISYGVIIALIMGSSGFGYSEIIKGGFPDTNSSPHMEAISVLKAFGIVKGDGDTGNYRPEDYLSRQEFAIIVSRYADLIDRAGSNQMMGDPIPGIDITVNQAPGISNNEFIDQLQIASWAFDAVKLASENGWVKGYEDGSFKPDRNLTYAEAITVLIRVLRFEGTIDTVDWPKVYLEKADELNMLDDLKIMENEPITRAGMAQLTYNGFYIHIIKSNDSDSDGDGLGDVTRSVFVGDLDSDDDGLPDQILMMKPIRLENEEDFNAYGIWKTIDGLNVTNPADEDSNKRLADLKKLADELVNVVDLNLDADNSDDGPLRALADLKKLADELVNSIEGGEDPDIAMRIADLKKLADELVNLYELNYNTTLIGAETLEDLSGQSIRVVFNEDGNVFILMKD